MKRHSRIPAAGVLVAAMVVGGIYVSVWGRSNRGGTAQGLEQIESLIATGKADAATWDSYGQKLSEVKQYSRALAAYRKALDIEPTHRDARFHYAMALATSGDHQASFDYMRELVYSDPKLAEELFARPELGACLAEARFKTLAGEAHVQAMD